MEKNLKLCVPCHLDFCEKKTHFNSWLKDLLYFLYCYAFLCFLFIFQSSNSNCLLLLQWEGKQVLRWKVQLTPNPWPATRRAVTLGGIFPITASQRITFRWPKNMPLVNVAWLYLDNNGMKCRVAGHCHSHAPSICFSMTWKILKYWLFFKKKGPQVLWLELALLWLSGL